MNPDTKEDKCVPILGSNNPNCKGNNVGIDGIHVWIRRYKTQPEFCEKCHQKPPYNLANISGKYLRDLNDWKYLCRKCHMLDDRRMKNLRRGGGRKSGFIVSEETRKKLSIALIGRYQPWHKRDPQTGRFIHH